MSELLTHLGDVDLVLIEGYKHGDHPKLELRRMGQDAPHLAESDDSICAIVCDVEIPDAPVPVLDRSDVAGITKFILHQVDLPLQSTDD